MDFKTKNINVNFDNKMGRPKKKPKDKLDNIRKVGFNVDEINELEQLKESKEEYKELSFSMFLRQLVKKGLKC